MNDPNLTKKDVGARPFAEPLLFQQRPLANESVFFIIRDDDSNVDCCGF